MNFRLSVKGLNRELIIGIGLGIFGSGLILFFFQGGLGGPYHGAQKAGNLDLTKLEERVLRLEQQVTEMNYRLQPDNNPEQVDPSPTPMGSETQITIPPGATSDQIGEILLAANLISDKEEFLRYIEEQGWQGRFQVGQFRIPQGITIAEIATILTRRPEAAKGD